jgi:tellurite resistance-related uncharacterized protein
MSLPPGLTQYKTLGPFTETTIPAGLLRRHTLKAGVWGRIVVLEGGLRYVIDGDPEVSFDLTPGAPGLVAPEKPHRVAPSGTVKFHVEFWRRA